MFDAVVCISVLEHVPESCVKDVLTKIDSKAVKAVYVSIFRFPTPELFLPNGVNYHCTLREESWWIKHVIEVNTLMIPTQVKFSDIERQFTHCVLYTEGIA
jgi:hypothetical protein